MPFSESVTVVAVSWRCEQSAWATFDWESMASIFRELGKEEKTPKINVLTA
jgi:hypothetical protein